MTFQLLQSDPPWLVKAAGYLGFHETGNNQGIGEFIQLSGVGSPGDPWCAIFANACLRSAGYAGSGSALARSFEHSPNFVRLDQPKRGAICTYWRGSQSAGTGHVDFWTATEGGRIQGLGGNQSDAVNVAPQDPAHLTGYWWPAGAQRGTPPPAIPPSDAGHPLIATGATGAAVVELQHRIGIPEDGDFGDTTRWTVKGYQLEHGLDADGEVGPLTWDSLRGATQITPSQPTHTLSDGAAICRKLLDKFGASSIVGVSPSDGAQFGITTGSVSQWAVFGTAVCAAESGFNPRSANTSDPGGSFGIFQYAHNQVPGGNAYDIDASVSAFVRDAESSAKSGSLQRGILGQRFSTIGRHPDRTTAQLSKASRLAAEAQQTMLPSPQPAPLPPRPTPQPTPTLAPVPAPGPQPMPAPPPAPAPDFSDLQQAIAKLIATIGAASQQSPPAAAPAPAPAAQPPPAAPATMGIEHLGILGLLTTLATHFSAVAPLIGPDASLPAQVVAATSTFMLGSGFMSRIGPTLSAIFGFLAKISTPEK